MNATATTSQRATAAIKTGTFDPAIRTLPILVLFPHNRCNCRCVMCDIWRIRQTRQITVRDIEPHVESIRRLRVRWVVFSGGEPQLNQDFEALSSLLRAAGVRLTLLTAGLLLESHALHVGRLMDDVIVSLDGPRDIHNEIRGVPQAFERLARGLKALRKVRPQITVGGRCTVQRANCKVLRATVSAAKALALNSVSFLAADLTSQAFNRPEGWSPTRRNEVAPDALLVDQLEREVENLILEHSEDICSGYISESQEKLRRIVFHFRAHLGQACATAPRCNAPWVSAVIEADGTVRPCFFQPALGNIHDGTLVDVLNSEQAVWFRETLDVATNPVCQTCVCSLYLTEEKVAAMRILKEPQGASVGSNQRT